MAIRRESNVLGTVLCSFVAPQPDEKLFRKSFLTLTGFAILALLAISPAYAAPSLGLGSTASYALTGSLKVQQSCTADPVAYAGSACSGSVVSISSAFVTVTDDGHCGQVSTDPFSALRCRFTPDNVTVSQGGAVVWFNNGNQTHVVAANVTANGGLPTFNSGPISPGASFSLIFNQTGIYHYYDPNYAPLLTNGLLTGIVIVTTAPPPPPPPPPTTVQVDLSGTIGWLVEGLSTSQANLNVSHSVSVSVSPIPGISLTPVTESGSFEQSINLSTRVESPSTSMAIVKSFSSSPLSAFAGTTLATGGSGSIFQNMISSQSNSPDYTTWWVNGPLSLGSPVQILQGWSSVTGSENLNLGGTLGTRSAWIVTSQTSEKASLNIPNPSSPLSSSNSNAIVNLKFLWSYDKSANLLLRNDNSASLSVHSENPTTIYTSAGPVSVTATHDMVVNIDVALTLSSTSLSLPRSPSHTATLMDMLSVMPWMPLGIAGLAAGLAVGAIVWFTRRAKGETFSAPAPAPQPGTVAPPATPS